MILTRIQTRRDRELRRRGLATILLLDLAALILTIAFILIALIAARGGG
jgi:hypothetical protein